MSHASPDLPGFRELARSRRVIPVVRRLLADGDTPVGLYRKLAAERPGTFLLESAEHGRVWSRYSFIGVQAAAMLSEVDGHAVWRGRAPVGVPTRGNPLEAMRDTLALLHTQALDGDELPPLTGGLVGMIGYDAVRRWERLPDANPDELRLPEIAMLLAVDLAVLDHWDGTVLLIANAVNYDATDERVGEAWADAVARLDAMETALAQPSAASAAVLGAADHAEHVRARTRPEDYMQGVEAAKEHIRAGDAFQIVLSQRFERPTTASALDIYRMLRVNNPSPYMYLFRFPEPGPGPDLGQDVAFDVIGSSPEALVKLTDGHAMLHPIAGTRPRGATPEADAVLAEELLADEKERAEHLMLVDLGRNDLGRVCAPGTVEVVDFMSIEKYSHVMHIVSTVTGRWPWGARPTTCWPPPSRPARCRGRRSRGRWRSSTTSSRRDAACTAVRSATWTSRGTWMPRSRSGQLSCAPGSPMCRPGPVWSPTRCRRPSTTSAGTRLRRCSPRSQWPRGCVLRALRVPQWRHTDERGVP